MMTLSKHWRAWELRIGQYQAHQRRSLSQIIGLLCELANSRNGTWGGGDMKTTINSSLILQGKSSTRSSGSSSSSTTGVSVREPLNVRLQRLLSSDQSSAYTILDILQVIFTSILWLQLHSVHRRGLCTFTSWVTPWHSGSLQLF